MGTRVFFTGGDKNPFVCVELRRADGLGNFRSTQMMPMKHPRYDHSVCQVLDRYLCVTGSTHSGNRKKVEIYDSQVNTWQCYPNLNRGRSFHASCAILDKIYVFCGVEMIPNTSTAKDAPQSIQASNASFERYCFDGKKRSWKTIEFKKKTLAPRFSLGVA